MKRQDADWPPLKRPSQQTDPAKLTSRAADLAIIVVGVIATVFALDAGQVVLAPVVTAVIIGLMVGPIATRLEARGLPSPLSAGVVVILFLALLSAFVLALAAPLSTWSGRIPQIWNELQLQLAQLREPIATLKSVQEQLRGAIGSGTPTIAVEDSSPVQSVATLAPTVVAQVLLFLASLYFFMLTRFDIRAMILRLCVDDHLRWRAAHVFRDVERLVSRYLLSITLVNIGLGVSVTLAMYLIGLPSPFLWGALAGLLNFVTYLGPAVMAIILFAVGLLEFDTLAASMLPPLAFLFLNMIEAQFVTPSVLGRTMTLNPFLVVLAIAFWIWIWGALGGFIAVPVLLIIYAIVTNIMPQAGRSTAGNASARDARSQDL
ncbi:AI-2E family transporter [Mesorhizobium xinjiangense]|uniref:AI-2E family transporter n=1 Tax=Mesorhizobium xinjiangense TaxID=2678685 RepID=UPI0012EDACDA|nr:AI-2E family transporter [Mesorhizobium xinjiangense]